MGINCLVAIKREAWRNEFVEVEGSTGADKEVEGFVEVEGSTGGERGGGGGGQRAPVADVLVLEHAVELHCLVHQGKEGASEAEEALGRDGAELSLLLQAAEHDSTVANRCPQGRASPACGAAWRRRLAGRLARSEAQTHRFREHSRVRGVL